MLSNLAIALSIVGLWVLKFLLQASQATIATVIVATVALTCVLCLWLDCEFKRQSS